VKPTSVPGELLQNIRTGRPQHHKRPWGTVTVSPASAMADRYGHHSSPVVQVTFSHPNASRIKSAAVTAARAWHHHTAHEVVRLGPNGSWVSHGTALAGATVVVAAVVGLAINALVAAVLTAGLLLLAGKVASNIGSEIADTGKITVEYLLWPDAHQKRDWPGTAMLVRKVENVLQAFDALDTLKLTPGQYNWEQSRCFDEAVELIDVINAEMETEARTPRP
jgi:hypothetical protein